MVSVIGVLIGSRHSRVDVRIGLRRSRRSRSRGHARIGRTRPRLRRRLGRAVSSERRCRVGLGKPRSETRKTSSICAFRASAFGARFDPGKSAGISGAFGAAFQARPWGRGVARASPPRKSGVAKSGVEPGGDDELGAGRGQEDLAACEAQEREERARCVADRARSRRRRAGAGSARARALWRSPPSRPP